MTPLVTGALLTLVGGLVGSLVTLSVARATRKEGLRLAAVEKRLAVHQEAYSLWWRLLKNLHERVALHESVVACQEWWYQNCLYLDPASRQAFAVGCGDATIFNDIREPDEKKRVFHSLIGVLGSLARGVELPTLGEHEWSDLQRPPGASQ